jgi:hypothetical protein
MSLGAYEMTKLWMMPGFVTVSIRCMWALNHVTLPDRDRSDIGYEHAVLHGRRFAYACAHDR